MSSSKDVNQSVTSNKWFFNVDNKNVTDINELSFGRIKAFLYTALHKSITRHDLAECFQLIKVLPKETSLDPYVLFRFIMILVETNKTQDVNKNVMIYLESLISKLDLSKPDVFVEFLGYFIKNRRFNDAKELLSLRHRKMAQQVHRILPYIDINMRCYEFLLNYISWTEKVDVNETKISFDISIQGWLVNAMDVLKQTSSNHEYFVMRVVRVLLYYGYSKKAYLFVSEFQRNNPDNLSAQLLQLNLISYFKPLNLEDNLNMTTNETNGDIDQQILQKNRLNDLEAINNFPATHEVEEFEVNKYPLDQDRVSAIRNIKRLDSSRHELMSFIIHDNLIDVFQDLMDGMEYVHELTNVVRWSKLEQVLDKVFNSNNDALITDAQFVWHTRYKRYWNNIDFVALTRNQVTEQELKLIERVCNIISHKLNAPMDYE